ncbi:MAG: helix-turn-helix transcriptional regulator [Actinobacteria bacterium]|nr:helix-turn-helix transcriptional regulator [Actinomycetota bacterium]
MGVADRVVERSVRGVRSRAEQEVHVLLEAAFSVLHHGGINGLTVAEVLAEAGLSTRAFYRHFAGKDELVLALFARESERATAKRRAAIAGAGSPRAALDAWVDDVLALGYEPRRAARTRVLQSEGTRLAREFPKDFARIRGDELSPLVEILERGCEDGTFPDARPQLDARTIHAVVWSLASARLDGLDLSVGDVRAHVMRYCLPALGVGKRRP